MDLATLALIHTALQTIQPEALQVAMVETTLPIHTVPRAAPEETIPPIPMALQITQPGALQVAMVEMTLPTHTVPQAALEETIPPTLTVPQTQLPAQVVTATTPPLETTIHQTTAETRRVTPLLASCSRRQVTFSRMTA